MVLHKITWYETLIILKVTNVHHHKIISTMSIMSKLFSTKVVISLMIIKRKKFQKLILICWENMKEEFLSWHLIKISMGHYWVQKILQGFRSMSLIRLVQYLIGRKWKMQVLEHLKEKDSQSRKIINHKVKWFYQ